MVAATTLAVLITAGLAACSAQAPTCNDNDAVEWPVPADADLDFTGIDSAELAAGGISAFAGRTDVICSASVTGTIGEGSTGTAQVVYLSSSLDELADDLEDAVDTADLSVRNTTDEYAVWASVDGDRGVAAYAAGGDRTLVTVYGF